MKALYEYAALEPQGNVRKGVLRAESVEDARLALLAQGLFVDRVRLTGGRTPRVRLAESAAALEMLARVLAAELPMHRALEVLERSAPPSWRASMPALQQGIREGESVSLALETARAPVPAAVLGIIRAGENFGQLSEAVTGAATYMREAADTASALRSALAYPALLALVTVGAVVVLATVILPQIAGILAQTGAAAPPLAAFVLGVTGAAAHHWAVAAFVMAAAIAAWFAASTRLEWHVQKDRVLLSLPVAGRIRWSAATARVARVLGAMLEAGVPAPIALQHAATAAGSAAVHEALIQARARVVAGESFAQALEATQAFPPSAIQLIQAGESAGALASILRHVASIESHTAQTRLQTALRLLEPALILAIAGVVGVVAGALLQSIYAVRPA